MNTPVHQYIATKRDFLDAQRLHRKNRPWAALVYYLWYLGVPIICFAYLVYFVRAWFGPHGPDMAWMAGGAAIAAYLLLVLPLARWFQIRKLWNAAQPAKHRGQPVTLQFDGQQIISARPGASEGRFYWTAIEDYAEDDRLALIYVRQKLFLFVPKRAMRDAEWARLRAIALPRKAKR